MKITTEPDSLATPIEEILMLAEQPIKGLEGNWRPNNHDEFD